jgi:CheY-like chemotaxis protein
LTLRCVIVEDNPAVLRAARDLLESQGIAVVRIAATGEEAVRLVGDREPDVVLVDIDRGAEGGSSRPTVSLATTDSY